jgi:hypothetical protein
MSDRTHPALTVAPITAREAADLLVPNHYLHRKAPTSHAYGLFTRDWLVGAVTFGVPASRHLQKSVCPSDPSQVLELNRLWTRDDDLPDNAASFFVSRALKALPAHLIASYADPAAGHYGYVYRALNFRYAGWTDMDRKTPRFDYIPLDPTKHTREASRSGVARKVRRVPKVRYWTATGDRAQRRHLAALCGWPSLDWRVMPPPVVDPILQHVTTKENDQS